MDRGWTNRPVATLKTDALLDETLHATYDSGYYSDKPEYYDLHQAAVNRRRECFSEIEKRLKGRKE